LRVELAAQNDATATFRIQVADTGIGIPPERAPALFSPFVQADASTTRKYGGTGLGLTICRQLVEMMGGQIGFESEWGRGTSFWFTVAFEKQSTQSCRLAVGNVRVLVVDDHAASREVAVTLLNSWGCRTAEAADSESAFSLLRQASRDGTPFRAAVLDDALPGTAGKELVREFQSHPELEETAVVLMCGRPEGRSGRRGFDAARWRVAKPVFAESLYAALNAALGRSVAPGGAGDSASMHASRPVPALKGRILMAEDNLVNQEIAAAILDQLGYSVTTVVNGVEAVKAVQGSEFDLILMDCQMPEMDGYETTRYIREPRNGARNPKIPIIALTASALSSDRENCMRAGMDDFLSKPVEPEALEQKLAKWLQGKKPERDMQEEGPAETVFDGDTLLKRLMGNRSAAKKIVRAFLDDVPVQLASLKRHLDAADGMAASRQAHALKGAAANITAARLRALALEVEQAASAGELERTKLLLPRMEEQVERLEAEMRRSGWT